jgi:hypothetical protein
MTNTLSRCKLCDKRILSHEKTVECSTCKGPWHNKCLPNYSEGDILHASTPLSHWSCPLCLKEFFPFSILENDTSFNQDLIHPHNPYIEIAALEKMVYDPFSSDDNVDDIVLSDIDPDQNFLGSIRDKATTSCNYYYTSSQLDKILDLNTNAMTSMLHMNIRSIPKNLDLLIATLQASSMEIDLIGVTETWLKPDNADSYGIQGYTHEYLTRDKQGGGISLFINYSWIYKIRDDLNHSSSDYEML